MSLYSEAFPNRGAQRTREANFNKQSDAGCWIPDGYRDFVAFRIIADPVSSIQHRKQSAQSSCGRRYCPSNRFNLSSLKLYIFRCPGKRDHISDITDTRHQHEQSFESKSKTAVFNRTVFAGLDIPPVIFF